MATITLIEAATRLGVAPSTLRHQIRRGHFNASKMGRDWVTTEREVEKYRAGHKMDPEMQAKYQGPKRPRVTETTDAQAQDPKPRKRRTLKQRLQDQDD